ncbi:hypothetical protein NBRC116587_21160 [Pseudoteredinibacter isoporae]
MSLAALPVCELDKPFEPDPDNAGVGIGRPYWRLSVFNHRITPQQTGSPFYTDVSVLET